MFAEEFGDVFEDLYDRQANGDKLSQKEMSLADREAKASSD